MSYFVVGMGGSGARSIEALIYLCAAGLGPERLDLVFVDSDQTNDAWRRVGELVANYGEIQALLAAIPNRQSALFRTEIVIRRSGDNALVWDPIQIRRNQNKLNLLFARRANNDKENLIYQATYSPAQQNADLDIGFQGNPSIGAAVLAKCFDAAKAPWNNIIQDIQTRIGAAQPVWFFQLGSLFGGTGVTGMRLIPRMVWTTLVQRMAGDRADAARQAPQDAISNSVRWGAAFLLPYFTFNRPPDPSQRGIGPEPQTFVLRARQAIEYFGQYARDPQFNRVYAIGVEAPVMQSVFALGGNNQKNSPHVVELLAAVAALDFKNCAANAQNLILVARGDPQTDPVTRQQVDRFEWQDVPPVNNQPVQQRLGHLADAAFAYLKLFKPAIDQVLKKERVGERTPWYVDLLASRGVDAGSQAATRKLGAMAEFSLTYFGWLRGLHPAGGGMRVELAKTDVFPSDESAEWPEPAGRGGHTLLLETTQKGLTLDAVWKLMCDHLPGKPKPDLAGLADFFEALFSLRK